MADTQPAEELAAGPADPEAEASTPDDAAPPAEDPPPVTEEAAENVVQESSDKAYPWQTTRPAEITPPEEPPPVPPEEPPPVIAEANAQPDDAAPEADVTEPSKVDPKSWSVDTSYIDYRTADPDRLESRRAAGDVAEEGLAAAGLPAANVVSGTTAKDEDGKYKVDTSYINHRTADPNNLEIRRTAADGAEEGAPGAGMPASGAYAGSTAKDDEGKYKVDTSYINHRTADPNNLESRRAADGAEDGAPAAGLPSSGAVVGATAKDEDGKYKVDMAYINHRTADPNRLESRRSVAGAAEEATGLPTSDVFTSATAKDEDGKYKVDTSYINHRTADPNNLESRRGADVAEEGAAAACLPTGVFAGTAAKDEDGKWQQVNTSYINQRTADPERLEVRRGDKDTEDKPVASATVKKEADGKWNVDTSYIDYRTTDPNRLEPRRGGSTDAAEDPAQNTELNLPSAPSATVKKEADGTWKVDTSYIEYRTGDTNNLTRKEEESKNSQNFSDPAEKKYSYEELKGIGSRPADVDPERKELYLSEDEFKVVFEMGPAEFAKFPKWKRQNIKKSKDLF